jgi:dipeptidyl aminopeptidase/acylaminoacyl peptidase
MTSTSRLDDRAALVAQIEETRRRTRGRRRRHGILALLVAAIGAGAILIGPVGAGAGSFSNGSEAGGALTGNGPLTIVSGKPRDGSGGGIYTVARSGLGRRLFHCAHSTRCAELEGLAWSPDGTRLAYGVESIGASYFGLYVLDLSTGRRHHIRHLSITEARWLDLAWSPDGTRLAYVSDARGLPVAGGGAIVVINADGSGRRVLPTGTADGHGAWPAWSPDATRIAFATRRTGGSVYVMGLDGSHRRLLVGNGSAPAWSPDGTRLAYLAPCGIRLVTAAGRDVPPPSPHTCSGVGGSGAPVWSPDGRQIAWATRAGVFVMHADGTHLTHLTSQAPWSIASDSTSWLRPAWQPKP